MSMTVYGALGSMFVRKVLVTLEYKNLSYSIEPVIPGQLPEGYKKIHPLGKIPAIKDGDLTIPDSSVICQYLDKKYPEPSIYPKKTEDFAKALWFEEYGDTAMAEVVGGKIFFQKIIKPLLLKQKGDEELVKEGIEVDLPNIFTYLEGQVGETEFIVGNQFSIGDISIVSEFANLALCKIFVDRTKWPKLANYVSRNLDRPSFHKIIEKENKVFGF